jgi:hypothetical protein
MKRYPPQYILLANLMGCVPAVAFAMEERVALMLSSPTCNQHYTAISNTLEQNKSVRHVDFQAVPGHVLIDIEAGTVTAEALERQINDALATTASCRVEIMKSCISADLRASSKPLPSSIVRDR